MSPILCLSACQSVRSPDPSPDPSPDGRFCVVVWAATIWVAMPGQSGDAPGVVYLYDAAGRKLESAPIKMVQLFEGAQWSAHQVEVDLGLDRETWRLPQETGNQTNADEPSNACFKFEPGSNS